MDTVKISLPRFIGGVDLVPLLLEEFEWDFEYLLEEGHHVATANCSGHDDPAAYKHGDDFSVGNFSVGNYGVYKNASMYCPHCFPSSNPAEAWWDEEGITIQHARGSTKGLRALKMLGKALPIEEGFDEQDIEVMLK